MWPKHLILSVEQMCKVYPPVKNPLWPLYQTVGQRLENILTNRASRLHWKIINFVQWNWQINDKTIIWQIQLAAFVEKLSISSNKTDKYKWPRNRVCCLHWKITDSIYWNWHKQLPSLLMVWSIIIRKHDQYFHIMLIMDEAWLTVIWF